MESTFENQVHVTYQVPFQFNLQVDDLITKVTQMSQYKSPLMWSFCLEMHVCAFECVLGVSISKTFIFAFSKLTTL
jgi:hypothetical protein